MKNLRENEWNILGKGPLVEPPIYRFVELGPIIKYLIMTKGASKICQSGKQESWLALKEKPYNQREGKIHNFIFGLG